jgi:hypothetical protein
MKAVPVRLLNMGREAERGNPILLKCIVEYGVKQLRLE